jgi:hypothetical protein
MALVHQETWVRFGTNGIGISDHQNRYSNGVRVANWVENEFGEQLKVRSARRRALRLLLMLLLMMLRAGLAPPSMLTQDIPRAPIPHPRVLTPA